MKDKEYIKNKDLRNYKHKKYFDIICNIWAICNTISIIMSWLLFIFVLNINFKQYIPEFYFKFIGIFGTTYILYICHKFIDKTFKLVKI